MNCKVFLVKSKSEIIEMVCPVIIFENISKDMLKNDYRMKHVKWSSST
jgi:hypothetical protein